MTDDDKAAIGPEGVALAEALGQRDPTLHEALTARGFRAEPARRMGAKGFV